MSSVRKEPEYRRVRIRRSDGVMTTVWRKRRNQAWIKKCTRRKVGIVMKEFKNKKLRAYGKEHRLVTNPKQAIAIALSIAKKKCN